MAKEMTITVDEKDGAVIIPGEDGKPTRYVKESDLLAVKGSKENLGKQLEEATKGVEDRVEAERQRVFHAEAKISNLEEQLKTSTGSATEMAALKQQLEAAKKSGEELGSKLLELRRENIVTVYGIPRETVDKKSLSELNVFEEALKAVLGTRKTGNYAVGGSGGGANPLQGKSPMELAQMAYSQK